MKCWGSAFYGQLGQGDSIARGDGPGEMGDNLKPVDLGAGRTATQVRGGPIHTCALLDDATVKCWGSNDYGQLAIYGGGRGSAPGQMGDNLPAVSLGTGLKAKALGGGLNISSVLTTNYQLKAWGSGAHGSLGQGHTNDIGDDLGEMGDALLPIVLLGPP